MSISLPTGFCPATFSLQLNTVQRAATSIYGGSMQVVDLLNEWWTASMTLPPRSHANAGDIEAFLNSLRGMTQTVQLHHFGRPQPRGTMRGSPVVALPLFVGDGGFYLDTTPWATLHAGDMLGVGGMLLQVKTFTQADAAGRMAVPIVNRVRKPASAGTSIVWDRPTVPFRCVSPTAVQYVPGYAEGVSLDFIEDVTL